jgi:phosphoribosylglycinamide formyltransferase 1
MKKIAIFASGGGSNALKIIEHFANSAEVKVALVVANKAKAGVLEKAANHHIPTLIIGRKSFYETEDLLTQLNEYGIDFIALAGFLWLIPTYLVDAFPNKIVNIHPALLPKYGGKGMYGMNVHQAVHAAKDPISGMTIHFVNAHYDEGNIIFQAQCELSETDTPEEIASKVLVLEHRYFPQVIENVIRQMK